MSKCSIDIRKDIVSYVSNKLLKTGYFTGLNDNTLPLNHKGSKNMYSIYNHIDNINKSFKEEVATFNSDSKYVYIDPSDELIGKYLKSYKAKELNNVGTYKKADNNVIFTLPSKPFQTRAAAIKYLDASSINPFFYSLVKVKGGWNVKLRDAYIKYENEITKLENCE